MLRFSDGRKNGKLAKLSEATGKRVYSFSLLSGWACPFAKECCSYAMTDDDGKHFIMDGAYTKFRCFSASEEVLYPAVFDQRSHNFETLKRLRGVDAIADVISASLPKKAEIVRIHVAGDFYSGTYFDAWLKVIGQNPGVDFYAYTKSLPLWVKRLKVIPENLMLTASYGGTHDELIAKHNLRFSKVVHNAKEAELLGLDVDSDDTHAALRRHKSASFALVVHGVQPKGSSYAKAVQENRKASN